MKREIKFRAWDGKQMFDVAQITFNDATWSCSNGRGVSIPYQPHINLMQFTGLQDKNGKEIYEGDIVRCEYSTGQVVFMLGCFFVRWIDDIEADMEPLGLNKKFRRGREDDEVFQIIGNIYENPEYINQKT